MEAIAKHRKGLLQWRIIIGVALAAMGCRFAWAAPSIASFSPASGIPGTTVTISGPALTDAVAVRFNGANAKFRLFGAKVFADVPSEATTGPIVVETPSGLATSTLDFLVLRAAVPTIESFVPSSGPVGTSVKVTGANFLGTTAVTYGVVAATFIVSSDSELTVPVPAGALTGPIIVTGPGGSATSAVPFVVSSLPLPVLTGVSPLSGPPGATVTLSGTDLDSVTHVLFGGVATVFQRDGSNLTAYVPFEGVTGLIEVRNPAGSAFSTEAFEVTAAAPPVITSFSPAAGPPGSTVTLLGSNFFQVVAVRFGDSNAVFFARGSDQLDANVPAGAASASITVVTATGSAQSSTAFQVTLPPPLVLRVAPESGQPGDRIQIEGSNFLGVEHVYFGDVDSAFTTLSTSLIEAVVPDDARTGLIAVTTPNGQGTSSRRFFVRPGITSFVPGSGTAGSEVVVEGHDFVEVSRVTVGGASAQFAVESAQRLRLLVPQDAVSGRLGVTTPGGETMSMETLSVMPLITSFVPPGGRAGTVVTVYGSGFTEVRRVEIGGIATPFEVLSRTELRATVASPAVSGLVEVQTAAGSTQSSVAFTAALDIDTFAPAIAHAGESVVIQGSGFEGVNDVTFNGASASFEVSSSTEIRAVVPKDTTVGPLTVTAASGTVASRESFAIMPSIDGFTPRLGGIGTIIRLEGAGLAYTTNVMFDLARAAFTIQSPTTLEIVVPLDATNAFITLDTRYGSARSSEPFLFGEGADLVLEVIGPDANGYVGQHLLATVRVRNAGPSAVADVIVSNRPGSELLWRRLQTTEGEAAVGEGGWVWRFGSLNAGSQATLAVELEPPLPGLYSNQVSVTAAGTDLDPANNQASIQGVAQAPELRLLALRPNDFEASWPLGASNFVLEVAHQVPAENWLVLPGAFQWQESRIVVSNRTEEPAGYFRLRYTPRSPLNTEVP